MNPRPDAMRARAYLLGALDDRERDLVEDGYVASAGALDLVEAAEEALIEDYLEGRLDARERDRFNRHYLASPAHRIRVEAIRGLARASRQQKLPVRYGMSPRLLAIAATLTIVATASVWVVQRSNRTGSTSVFSLTPATVRGTAEPPAIVIAPGADVVTLRLESDGSAGDITRGRVVIATVAGDEVWRGALTVGRGATPAGVLAAVAVPADRLRPDDYVVTLFETDVSGTETLRGQYFLRVRGR